MDTMAFGLRKFSQEGRKYKATHTVGYKVKSDLGTGVPQFSLQIPNEAQELLPILQI